MKRLYNIFSIIATICLIGTISSCNDWLEVSPDTEVDKGSLLKDESGFADAVGGIYANMVGNNLYGQNLTWRFAELLGGGAYPKWGDNADIQSFLFQPKNEKYKEALRNNYVDPIWNGEYNTIANINSLLEVIDEKKNVFEGNDYNVFKGELLGLRAFLHFDVLRLFADAYSSATYNENKTYIPYVTEITSNIHPLLTNNQACELMLKDLTEAKELLKSDPMYTGEAPSEYVCSSVTGSTANWDKYGIKAWHNRRFHFNYYAAVATMARIYLWMGDRVKAKECALEVINAQQDKFPWVNPTLVSNTTIKGDAVPRDRTFCTEQIFAMNILDLPDRTDGFLWQGEKSFSGGNIIGFNTDVFDANTQQYDIRYSYLRTNYSLDNAAYDVTTKYIQDQDANNYNSPWARNRVPLIRLSEMYYIAAECEDDLPTAKGYLEAVRSHRGLAAYPLDISSREELQEQIRLEYHKEMIGEGQTFYYYKRLNKDIVNKSKADKETIVTITPDQFTMPRPDNEDTYGGRKTDVEK